MKNLLIIALIISFIAVCEKNKSLTNQANVLTQELVLVKKERKIVENVDLEEEIAPLVSSVLLQLKIQSQSQPGNQVLAQSFSSLKIKFIPEVSADLSFKSSKNCSKNKEQGLINLDVKIDKNQWKSLYPEQKQMFINEVVFRCLIQKENDPGMVI